MDAACVRIDTNSLRLTYSGANNPLWIVREQELIEMKADKMPVGRSPKQEIPFSLQEIELQKNDCIYLFSDGYADQFGGPKGKKFKYKAFEEQLLEIAALPMYEQKHRLEQSFLNWKGELEQVDDVCIIGVRI
jgi:serine phosphatase RsbU (regulator of sigma subunit)